MRLQRRILDVEKRPVGGVAYVTGGTGRPVACHHASCSEQGIGRDVRMCEYGSYRGFLRIFIGWLVGWLVGRLVWLGCMCK